MREMFGALENEEGAPSTTLPTYRGRARPGLITHARETYNHGKWGMTAFQKTSSRSSSREVRIGVHFFFSVVYFSRGPLPPKRVKGQYWGA